MAPVHTEHQEGLHEQPQRKLGGTPATTALPVALGLALGAPRLSGAGPEGGRTGRLPSLPPVAGQPAVQRLLLQMQQTWGNRAVQQLLQPPAGRDAAPAATLGARIAARTGGGHTLPPGVQRRLEQGLGADLSGVRVHTDREADSLARAVAAVAFTSGSDIFFRAGAYQPASAEGLRLLAHEATHTVQQASGPVAGTPTAAGVALSDPGDRFERSADAAAALVLGGPPSRAARSPLPRRGAPVGGMGRQTGAAIAVQRSPDPPPRTFTPTAFSDPQHLIAAVVKDNPKQEDLVGACRYLNGLSEAGMLWLAQQIAARKPTAVTALQATAAQGWATSSVKVALAAVALKGEISRVGFAAEQASDLGVLKAGDAGQVLNVLGPAVPELDMMQKTKGFQALRPDEQARLTYLIGGSTSLSAQAPAALRAVLADRNANKDDPATFRKFLTDEKYLQFDVGVSRGKARRRDPFLVSTGTDVPNYAFGGISSFAANAIRYEVLIDAKDANGKPVRQTIPVFLPKSGGPKDRHYGVPTITEIAETLAATPDVSRSKIVHVDVHWMPSNEPPHQADPTSQERAIQMAAGSDGVVNIYPIKSEPHNRAQLSSTLIHETGHTASIAAWGGDVNDTRWDPWRAAMKADGMALSQYGKESLFEDFAESWALYAPAVGTPREHEVRALIPARCKLMDTLLWQEPIRPRK